MRVKPPRLVDVVVCDQVRQESTGKLLLIGVYLGNVVVFGLPTVLPSLSFVCKWDTGGSRIPEGEYLVVSPTGVILSSVPTKDEDSEPREGVRLAILQFQPFTFPEAGRYRLIWRPVGGRRKVLAEFPVEVRPTSE
jgi:hypothetical protein